MHISKHNSIVNEFDLTRQYPPHDVEVNVVIEYVAAALEHWVAVSAFSTKTSFEPQLPDAEKHPSLI